MLASPHPPQFILYARKSSESEDQQVASIDSQIHELKLLAQREGLTVARVLSEARSAKAPGRPIFNDLLARLHQGEASGILCWKLDRLARNPVDGGNVSWMLQQGIIQAIRTHDRTYCPTDNVLMMSVEFGMANQYVRDLSQNVRRGLQAKVERGWYPGVAKPGYLNTMDQPQGERTTPPDPVRFPLLQQAFQRVLSGRHTPSEVLRTLNEEWGYRTPHHRKLGGQPLSHSSFYRILTDPFYYGLFEFPKGSGRWYQGRHEPMITKQEFERVQARLGRKGRLRAQRLSFAYTGLMRCGTCGAAITASIKEHTICTRCGRKFSSRHRSDCPACGLAIAKMRRPIQRQYEYYHCSRHHGPCKEKSVQTQQLERQILQLLDSLTLSEPVKDWCIQRIERAANQPNPTRAAAQQAIQEALDDAQRRRDNLLQLAISPQNSAGELLSAEELASQRAALTRQVRQLEAKKARVDDHAGPWKEAAIRTFNFACYARNCFEKGSIPTKRAILSSLGSNLALEHGNLRISLHKHLLFVQAVHCRVRTPDKLLEPRNLRLGQPKNRALSPAHPTWLGSWDDVRTLFHSAAAEGVRIPKLIST